ncbi:MAG: DUF5996 family protein [Pyrinomonadaceae bacterium]
MTETKRDEIYPALPLSEWQETNDTLHMWTQIVGKIRLVQTPPLNQWWNVPLYVTPRGLTTSAMPFENESFTIDFDFLKHHLIVQTSYNDGFRFDLEPMTVADFYRKLLSKLKANGIEVEIRAVPDEVADPIPFAEDTVHKSYDREHVSRFFRVLRSVDRVFKEFRSRFCGKCSPVHFFWGSFDLAVTRFSGRPAPPRPKADRITRIAYDEEVISHGFWTGNGLGEAAFYAYAAPEPKGFAETPVNPDEAFYSKEMGEFFLKYEDVRRSADPDGAILDFMQTTYKSAADLAHWDCDKMEIDWKKVL